MVIWMNGLFAAERRACDLTAAVRNDFIHVHIELCSASRHPHVKGKHVLVLASQDLVTRPENQLVLAVVEPAAVWLAFAAPFFKVAYAVIISRGMRSWPMLKCSSERCVCPPQSLSLGHIHLTQAIRFCANAHYGRINRCTHGFVVLYELGVSE